MTVFMASQFRHLKLSYLILLLLSTTAHGQASYDQLIQQALQARNAGNFVTAESTLRQARSLAAESNEVDLLLGMTLAFQERYIEALEIRHG